MKFDDSLRFVKMQGAGNDYVYIDCMNQTVPNPAALARRISRRHFSIGSDGLILIRPSSRADCFMDIYNADGSRGKTCGNGLRCTAKYMYETYLRFGAQREKTLTIETLSGCHQIKVLAWSLSKALVSVNMGQAKPLDWMMPAVIPGMKAPISTSCISMVNPHRVLFMDAMEDLENMDLAGRYVEHYCGFPERVNVEFCAVNPMTKDTDRELDIKVRVFERGSGETLACGSGACAVAAVFLNKKQTKSGMLQRVYMHMPGGTLTVEKVKENLWLTGDAVTVCHGEIALTSA